MFSSHLLNVYVPTPTQGDIEINDLAHRSSQTGHLVSNDSRPNPGSRRGILLNGQVTRGIENRGWRASKKEKVVGGTDRW